MIRVFIIDKFIGLKTRQQIEAFCTANKMTARFKNELICIVVRN